MQKYGSYIVKNHNGIYYFRYIIPINLRRVCPTLPREVRKSLQTSNKKMAIKKAQRYKVYMDDYMNKLNQMDRESDEQDQAILLLNQLEALKKCEDGLLPPADNEELDDFIATLTSGQVALIEKYQDWYYQELKNQSALQSNFKSEKVESVAIDTLIEKFLAEKSNKQKGTVKGYRSQIELFLKLTGIKKSNDINKVSLRLYRENIQKLPPRIKTSKEYRNKSLEEIFQITSENPNLPRLNRKTINVNIGTVFSFMKWLSMYKYIEPDLLGMLQPLKVTSDDDEDVLPFSVEDLDKIFSVPDYIKLKKFRKYAYRYWIPLIGLFSGARLNEICQMHVSDIKTTDGILYFDINDVVENEDSIHVKHVKNESSKRLVPVHNKLIELGFKDYLKSVEGEELLFPQLKKNSRDRYYATPSKFFNAEYKTVNGEKIGFLEFSGVQKNTRKGRKNFHSFRHTFVNHAKQNGFLGSAIIEIVGHDRETFTDKNYADDLNLKVKQEMVNKIEYGCKLPSAWC